jgi:hypothetical protein
MFLLLMHTTVHGLPDTTFRDESLFYDSSTGSDSSFEFWD